MNTKSNSAAGSGCSSHDLFAGAVVLATRDIPKLIHAGQYVCRKGDRLVIEEDLTAKDCPHDYAVCMEENPSWKFAVRRHEICPANSVLSEPQSVDNYL